MLVLLGLNTVYFFVRDFYFIKIPWMWLPSWRNFEWVDYHWFNFVIVWFNLNIFKPLGIMDKYLFNFLTECACYLFPHPFLTDRFPFQIVVIFLGHMTTDHINSSTSIVFSFHHFILPWTIIVTLFVKYFFNIKSFATKSF